MNERIKQLALQAEEEIKAEYEDEKRRNRRLYNEIFLPKFAELIVRECAAEAHRRVCIDGNDNMIYSNLLAHFGVEE
jgi:hypothetical protein